MTEKVDITTAQLFKDRFVEVLIAPDFETDALEFLRAKSKQLRILKLHKPFEALQPGKVVRQITGGLLVQDRDNALIGDWMTPTAAAFPDAKRELAEFGIKVCKHVKSNAIVLVREYERGQYMLLGMGAGQPNRVDSLRKLAVPRAEENIKLLYDQGAAYGKTLMEFRESVFKDCVLVSDAFFPFSDNIDAAATAGIGFIVEPGGSKKDEEVIAACDRYGIAMVFTGMRHFRH